MYVIVLSHPRRDVFSEWWVYSWWDFDLLLSLLAMSLGGRFSMSMQKRWDRGR